HSRQDHCGHRDRSRHRRSRQDQDARSQRLRSRGRQGASPRHGAVDGPQGRLNHTSQYNTRPARPRPAVNTTEGDTDMSGKKYADAAKKFDRDQLFTPAEAIALVKSLAAAKFDETVEFAVRLGVDPRKADQMVRGTVALPSGTGKDVRVAVFAAGEAA